MPRTRRPVETAAAFEAAFGTDVVPWDVAVVAGFTRGALDAAVRRGLLHRPRRGVLRVAGPHSADEGAGDSPTIRPRMRVRAAAPFEVHADATRAAMAAVGEGYAATHDSAAILLGVARPTTREPGDVQLASLRGPGFVTPGLRVRATPVPDEDRTEVDGVAVTGLARTAIDLARGQTFASALIPLDSAARRIIARDTGAKGNELRRAVRQRELRQRAADELQRAYLACFGWAGTVVVRRALDVVDPASESATESRSRGWFLEAGIRCLAAGEPVVVRGRTYWADFCSREHRVIGEADGWSKYDGTPAEHRQAVERERERQSDLESDGWLVVRWTSTERRNSVVTRMSSALRRI